MNTLSTVLLAALIATGSPQPDTTSAGLQHFIFFNRDRDRITEASFLKIESIVGAQLKYTWRELEPERDQYNFQPLLGDLTFLKRHGKRLFIQLQDVSFDERTNVPDYLSEDPAFNGGVARKYEGHDAAGPHFDGWVARRWDPAVRERFVRLLDALGESVDGRIEGLILPETVIGFDDSRIRHPKGFTYEAYRDGVQAIMTGARNALPQTHVIQYANFMPGESLPERDLGYLHSIYEHAEQVGIGVGGPDILPHRIGQQNHSYPLIAARGPHLVAGMAVQWGNLEDINPATGERVTVAELHRFAQEQLHLNYIFWGIQEPFYSTQILPFLRDLSRDD